MPGFDLALDHRVVRRVDVLIERGRNLLHLERRQEAVVDAFLERVDVDRLAEVRVGVDVVLALRRRGQTELHGRRESTPECRASCFRRSRRRDGIRR